MRQKRLLLVLALALVSGVVAGLAALSYLRQQSRPLMAAETPKGKMVVAAKDLPLGTVLKPEDIRLIDWPGGALPAGFAATPGEVVGRGLITPVTLNEPVLKTKLASKEAGGGLSITIPEGMRGVSVKVDEVIGVAGFVLPGTRVDVMVTVQPPAGESTDRLPAVTKVVLQNVQVLASGQTIQRDAEGKPQTVTAITLMVSPEDAEKLVLAANEGRIQLALRNTLDPDSVATRGIRVAALVANTGPQAPVTRTVQVRQAPARTQGGARPQGGTVVETLRGGERTLQTFSSGNQ
jgi:pilus assembly protein CpaB